MNSNVKIAFLVGALTGSTFVFCPQIAYGNYTVVQAVTYASIAITSLLALIGKFAKKTNLVLPQPLKLWSVDYGGYFGKYSDQNSLARTKADYSLKTCLKQRNAQRPFAGPTEAGICVGECNVRRGCGNSFARRFLRRFSFPNFTGKGNNLFSWPRFKSRMWNFFLLFNIISLWLAIFILCTNFTNCSSVQNEKNQKTTTKTCFEILLGK